MMTTRAITTMNTIRSSCLEPIPAVLTFPSYKRELTGWLFEIKKKQRKSSTITTITMKTIAKTKLHKQYSSPDSKFRYSHPNIITEIPQTLLRKEFDWGKIWGT